MSAYFTRLDFSVSDISNTDKVFAELKQVLNQNVLAFEVKCIRFLVGENYIERLARYQPLYTAQAQLLFGAALKLDINAVEADVFALEIGININTDTDPANTKLMLQPWGQEHAVELFRIGEGHKRVVDSPALAHAGYPQLAELIGQGCICIAQSQGALICSSESLTLEPVVGDKQQILVCNASGEPLWFLWLAGIESISCTIVGVVAPTPSSALVAPVPYKTALGTVYYKLRESQIFVGETNLALSGIDLNRVTHLPELTAAHHLLVSTRGRFFTVAPSQAYLCLTKNKKGLSTSPSVYARDTSAFIIFAGLVIKVSCAPESI